MSSWHVRALVAAAVVVAAVSGCGEGAGAGAPETAANPWGSKPLGAVCNPTAVRACLTPECEKPWIDIQECAVGECQVLASSWGIAVCTRPCETDADCDDQTVCVDPSHQGAHEPEGRRCLPRCDAQETCWGLTSPVWACHSPFGCYELSEDRGGACWTWDAQFTGAELVARPDLRLVGLDLADASGGYNATPWLFLPGRPVSVELHFANDGLGAFSGDVSVTARDPGKATVTPFSSWLTSRLDLPAKQPCIGITSAAVTLQVTPDASLAVGDEVVLDVSVTGSEGHWTFPVTLTVLAPDPVLKLVEGRYELNDYMQTHYIRLFVDNLGFETLCGHGNEVVSKTPTVTIVGADPAYTSDNWCLGAWSTTQIPTWSGWEDRTAHEIGHWFFQRSPDHPEGAPATLELRLTDDWGRTHAMPIEVDLTDPVIKPF